MKARIMFSVVVFIIIFLFYFILTSEPREFNSDNVWISDSDLWSQTNQENIYSKQSFSLSISTNTSLNITLIFENVEKSKSILLSMIHDRFLVQTQNNNIFKENFSSSGLLTISISHIISANETNSIVHIQWKYSINQKANFLEQYGTFMCFIFAFGFLIDIRRSWYSKRKRAHKKCVLNTTGNNIRKGFNPRLLSIRYHLNYLPRFENSFALAIFYLMISEPRSNFYPSMENFSSEHEIVMISLKQAVVLLKVAIIGLIVWRFYAMKFEKVSFELSYPISRESHWLGKLFTVFLFFVVFELIYLILLVKLRYNIYLNTQINYYFFLLYFFCINLLIDTLIFMFLSSLHLFIKEELISFLLGIISINQLAQFKVYGKPMVIWLFTPNSINAEIYLYLILFLCLIGFSFVSVNLYKSSEVN